MVVFDFDGIIVESRWGEKLWRWLAEKMKIKTPSALFLFQELVEVIFNIKLEPVKEMTEVIKKYKRAGCSLGILTDRSLFSLCQFFNSNNNGIRLDDFNFIQTRNSGLNRFIMAPLVLKNAEPIFFSEKTKSDSLTLFLNLKMFATKNNIKTQEILIIDDLPQILKAARINGFSISPPLNIY